MNTAWVPSLDRRCHCLLYSKASKEGVYDFDKLYQELTSARASLGSASLSQIPFLSLNTDFHFNAFLF